MIANNEKPRWTFYVTWIILTLLCVPIAWFLCLLILRVISQSVGDFVYVNGVRHITEDYLFAYVFAPVVGLLTGVVQYELLRRHLPRMGWWVLATTGGWLLGFLFIAIPIWLQWTDGSFSLALTFALVGLGIGAAQWLLLRRRLPRAGWWIAVNVVAWGLRGQINAGNGLDPFGIFSLGLLPACATAATLAFLMNQIKPAEGSGS